MGGVRYNNSMFVNGDLEGKFIMDRNLGARDTKYEPSAKGTMFFQYGSKNPFPGHPNGNTHETIAYKGRDAENWTLVTTYGQVKMSESIATPMLFRTIAGSTNWCSGVDDENIIWNDYETDKTTHGKSIYDPSPLGWKIPADGVWSNFDSTSMNDWDYDASGRSYPRGGNSFAFYPSADHRISTTGLTYNNITRIYFWTSTPITTQLSRYLYVGHDNVTTTNLGWRGSAISLRCVQHYE